MKVIMTAIVSIICIIVNAFNSGNKTVMTVSICAVIFTAIIELGSDFFKKRDKKREIKWGKYCKEQLKDKFVIDTQVLDGKDYSAYHRGFTYHLTHHELKLLIKKGYLPQEDYNKHLSFVKNLTEFDKIRVSYYEDCIVKNESYPNQTHFDGSCFNQYKNYLFDRVRFEKYIDYLKWNIQKNKLFESEAPINYKYYLDLFRKAYKQIIDGLCYQKYDV